LAGRFSKKKTALPRGFSFSPIRFTVLGQMKKSLLLLVPLFFLAAWLLLPRDPRSPESGPASLASPPALVQKLNPFSPAKPDPGAPASDSLEAFHSFVREEAKKLDSTTASGPDAERELGEKAARLSPEELAEAKKISLDGAQPANERILSIFLLGKAKSWDAIQELVLAPLGRRDAEPHSLEETASVREVALRYMGIDFLAEAARQNPERRADLERLSREVRDAGLKKHIDRRLRELQGK
jgi:hypothetical protein